ncbi:MAG: hypothetical protein K5886_04315 [Lachnospiraceae bacterium]|nr:hypothetical protein [Lachnospiraceae bacterium]
MFDDRFRSVFSKTEIELASSYPVCDGKKETVFFYSTQQNDAESYRVTEIKSAFSRDNATGAIREIPFEGEFSELTQKCRGEVISPEVFDDEAYDLEDEYYDLYEDYYEGIESGNPDPAQRKALSEILDRLIPESSLKDLYRYFGGDDI